MKKIQRTKLETGRPEAQPRPSSPEDRKAGPAQLILAPHADDEVIGCSRLLFNDLPTVVAYFDVRGLRRAEAVELATARGFRPLFQLDVSPTVQGFLQVLFARGASPLVREGFSVVWAPDPHFDYHPLHKEVGQAARDTCRRHRVRYGVYSTNMNAPYIEEMPAGGASGKRLLLNTYYPSQGGLWENDHRYFLFEGRAEYHL